METIPERERERDTSGAFVRALRERGDFSRRNLKMQFLR